MARAKDAPVVKQRRPRTVEALRNLAAALGSAATHEAASAAVRGAADGLREQLPPELDEQLKALLQDTLAVVGRMLHEVAQREQAAPGAFARHLAGATMRGALQELEAEWQDGGLPFQGLTQRLDHLLDQVSAVTASRDQEIRTPGERAHSMAAGVVDGAMERLHKGMPTVTADLRALVPVGGALAHEVGRELLRGAGSRGEETAELLALAMERAGAGLVHGVARALKVEARALGARLRRPTAWLAAGGALLSLGLLAARRRPA